MVSHNNDGIFYEIAIDSAKEGSEVWDLNPYFKARVGDSNAALGVRWYNQGLLTTFDGKQTPIISGNVGAYSIDAKTKELIMAPDAAVVNYTGTPNDMLPGGRAKYVFPEQMFPKEGAFKGFIGYVDESDGKRRVSGVTVWFKVLPGVAQMGRACDFYINDLDAALVNAKEKMRQAGIDFKLATDAALQDLRTKYQQEAQANADASTTTRAALLKLADAVGAIQDQIDAGNVVTLARYNRDYGSISESINKKLANISSIPEAYASLSDIESKYPSGKDGLMIAADTGHKYIWDGFSWQDAGVYQSVSLADRSIVNNKISQKASAFTVYQPQYWILDWDKSTITVPNYSHVYDDVLYDVKAGTYNFSAKDVSFVALDPTVNTLQFFPDISSVPQNDYLIGVIDTNLKEFSLKFKTVTADSFENDAIDFARVNLINQRNIPSITMGLITTLPWDVDMYAANPVVKVNGYSAYQFKGQSFTIAVKDYEIPQNDVGAYYLYLKLNYQDFTAEIKATDNLASISLPWIGYIETNKHVFRIFSQLNLKNQEFKLVMGGKISVDFESAKISFPTVWYVLNNERTYLNTKKLLEINYDGSLGAFFVGFNVFAKTFSEGIIISEDPYKIFNNYKFLGWVSVNTKQYDFGIYGSDVDKVMQPWSYKSITCLGDSITAGDGGEGKQIDSYVPRLRKWVGNASLNNYGRNGSKITRIDGDNGSSFVDRCTTIAGQDVVTIFGGINDFQWNAPLGTMADGPDKTNTFYGALKKVIITLSTNNPKAKLMLITPMKTTKFQYHTFDENGKLMENGNGNTQLDFVNAIKDVGDYYSIPVLDMYRCSNYSPYLGSQLGHDNYTVDGLHPTEHGYERIAQTIGQAINNL